MMNATLQEVLNEINAKKIWRRPEHSRRGMGFMHIKLFVTILCSFLLMHCYGWVVNFWGSIDIDDGSSWYVEVYDQDNFDEPYATLELHGYGPSELVIPSYIKVSEGDWWTSVPDRYKDSVIRVKSASSMNGCSATKIVVSKGIEELGSFSDCANLVSISIPDSVKAIWNVLGSRSQFENCVRLKSIELPDSLDNPEARLPTFINCSSLESVKFPSKITELPEGMFQDCSSLKSIDIPDSVKVIPRKLFWNCRSLESVNLPNGLLKIEEAAFAGCESLRTIHLPDSLQTIENGNYLETGVFSRSGLEKIDFPDSVTSLGSLAFYACSNLTCFIWPVNVTTMGRQVLDNCPNLEELVIVTSSSDLRSASPVVRNCPKLKRLTIQKEVIKSVYGDEDFICRFLGGYSDMSTTNIEHLIFADGADSVGNVYHDDYRYWLPKLKTVTISSSVTNVNVAVIGECGDLESYIVREGNMYYSSKDGILYDASGEKLIRCPSANATCSIADGAVAICENAFSGCEKLKAVSFPNSLESVGSYSFDRCTALQTVLMNEGLAKIGDHAFNQCKSLQRVVLPFTVEELPEYCFSNCTNLREINLTAGMRCIGRYAFQSCAELNVELPNNLTNIAARAFYKCTRLKDAEIPRSLEKLGDDAFAYCYNLSEVKLYDGLQVGRGAFNFCYGLRKAVVGKVKIPDTFTGAGLFSQCTNLTDVVIDEDASWLGWSSAFSGCKKLQQVKLPRAWKVIPSRVFYGCEALSDLETGNGIESIDNYAFYNCSSLRSVRIPAATTNVGNYAFNGVTMKG